MESKMTTQVGPWQGGGTSWSLKTKGKPQARLGLDWWGSSSAERIWGSTGAAGWGTASQEGHQQSKGKDCCPPLSTREVPSAALCPILGLTSNSKYFEKLERVQWWTTAMGRGTDCALCKEWLRALGLFSLQKRRLRRRLIATTNNLRGVTEKTEQSSSKQCAVEGRKATLASHSARKSGSTQGNNSSKGE